MAKSQITDTEVIASELAPFDGLLTCMFEAGNGFGCKFEFALPNVIGQMGLSRMNEASLSAMIAKALMGELGANGVVKK